MDRAEKQQRLEIDENSVTENNNTLNTLRASRVKFQSLVNIQV